MEYGHEVSSERSREEQTITEVRENECPICISSMATVSYTHLTLPTSDLV